MNAGWRRSVGVAGIGAGVALGVLPAGPAGAAPSLAGAVPAAAVPFAASAFGGYASGHEASVGALDIAGNTQAAGVVQAFSGASAVSPGSGLTAPIVGDDAGTAGTGLLVQPAQAPSVRAYGTGIGLSAGLSAAADGSANQLKVAGQATQVAPPDGPAVTDSLPSAAAPVPAAGLGLPAGLVDASALTGRGAAFYDPSGCPLGQPLSYGLGDAANVNLVDFSAIGSSNPLSGPLAGLIPTGGLPGLPGLSLPTTGALVSTSGSGASVAHSDSETYLSSNGDGTFGYTTQARETIAPVTVNLFGAAQLQITVSGSQTDPSAPPTPVTLTAKTTGEGTGAAVTLQANDFVGVNLTAGGTTTALLPPTSLQQLVGAGGIALDLNPSTLLGQLTSQLPGVLGGTPLGAVTGPLGGVLQTLGNTLQGVTGNAALPDVSFGHIQIGAPVRAINGASGTAPVITGGTVAAGAVDLASLDLGITASGAGAIAVPAQLGNLAHLDVGHLEANAADNAPITCDLPVIKAVNPTQVSAGDQFVYTIQIPDPAKLADLSCSLASVTATDTITDAQGTPAFSVVGVSNGGTITQSSPNRATITWSNLSYSQAAVGSPPTPPITLTVTVSTPSTSPAGVIQDVVAAAGTTAGCNGGVSGIADLGGVDGTALNGSYTLQQPAVVAAQVARAGQAAAGQASPAAQGPLPHTGGTGGLWQPAAGLAALGLGYGALTLVRRSRRLSR